MTQDQTIAHVLAASATIALVGASANPARPSHAVMAALQRHGYRVIPVNPGLAGQTLLGERVYAALRDIPQPIDMVDVFRAVAHVPAITDEAIAIGAKTLWLQFDIIDEASAARARAAWLAVVMDRCTKIEAARLGIRK